MKTVRNITALLTGLLGIGGTSQEVQAQASTPASHFEIVRQRTPSRNSAYAGTAILERRAVNLTDSTNTYKGIVCTPVVSNQEWRYPGETKGADEDSTKITRNAYQLSQLKGTRDTVSSETVDENGNKLHSTIIFARNGSRGCESPARGPSEVAREGQHTRAYLDSLLTRAQAQDDSAHAAQARALLDFIRDGNAAMRAYIDSALNSRGDNRSGEQSSGHSQSGNRDDNLGSNLREVRPAYAPSVLVAAGMNFFSGSTGTGLGYKNKFNQSQDEADLPLVYSVSVPITKSDGTEGREVIAQITADRVTTGFNFTETGHNGSEPTKAFKKEDLDLTTFTGTYFPISIAGVRASYTRIDREVNEIIAENGAELPKSSSNPKVHQNTWTFGAVAGSPAINGGGSFVYQTRSNDGQIDNAPGFALHAQFDGNLLRKQIPVQAGISYSHLWGPMTDLPSGTGRATTGGVEAYASASPVTFSLGKVRLAPTLGARLHSQTDSHGAELSETVVVPYAGLKVSF